MGIIIERQAPERGGRGVDAAPAGQCCCCCCCCLHTAGSLIGAITALSPTIKPTDLQESVLPSSALKGATLEPRFSANGLYWAMTALVSGVASTIILTNADRGNEQIAGTAFITALALPLFQLGASLISLFVILLSDRLGKEVRLRHLGKITLRSFIGGLIGVAIMLPLFARC